jgi:hypothetical protein
VVGGVLPFPPASTRASAMAKPSPWAPPVTTKTLPATLKSPKCFRPMFSSISGLWAVLGCVLGSGLRGHGMPSLRVWTDLAAGSLVRDWAVVAACGRRRQ